MNLQTPPRILVIGHHGKMGKMAVQAIEAHPDLLYAGGCDRDTDLAAAISTHQPTVGLDLTTPDVVFEHTKTFIQSGIHPVIGTSGLSCEQVTHLSELCQSAQLGGLIVPNFSIGACLMMHCAATAAQFFPNATITETHHLDKKDAPSATALATAASIQKARKNAPLPHHSTETHTGSLGACAHDVPIHAIRMPGALASQTVLMGLPGETFSLTHHTQDRSAFMPGICLACQQVSTLSELVIGLDSLLNLNP